MNIGPYALANQPVRRPDGRRDRPAVPPAVQAAGRGLRGVRNGGLAPDCGRAKRRSAAPTTTARASRSPCRSPAPIRRMMAEAARYNVERGAQIIDINMGCPAKKVCNVGRLGADAERAAGAAHRRGGGRRVRAARRAGHAEDPHRLDRDEQQCVAHRARWPKTPASRCSPCTAARAPHGYTATPNTTPLPRSKRRCASRWSPTATSTSPAKGARRARRHRRRRHHDRPRGAGASVDLPRDRAFPANGRVAAAAAHRRDPQVLNEHLRRSLRVLRRIYRRAHCAQAHRLVHSRPFRRQRVPASHEYAGHHARTTPRRQRITSTRRAISDRLVYVDEPLQRDDSDAETTRPTSA